MIGVKIKKQIDFLIFH